MNFFGPATPLTAIDIDSAAIDLKCEPNVIKSVLKVETNGSGFLTDGRPTILFESKTFGRLTNGMFHGSHPNLSTVKWDKTTYGKGGAHQYERLETAMLLNKEAALKSCSWGLFQIMGENFKQAGFKDVVEMVEAMVTGAPAHLKAFVSFINNSEKMRTALRTRDWDTFARYYNGPGYKENSYDIKLASAYKSFTKE